MMTPIKKKLDTKLKNFNAESFISQDPIQIPIEMMKRPDALIQDIEICAMWTAMISWGRRDMILKAARKLMDRCEWHPYDFIKSGEFHSIAKDETIYRTLSGDAFIQVCQRMFMIYDNSDSVQELIKEYHGITADELIQFLSALFMPAKLGNPAKNSACKRINMLMRWMIRHDNIDLGLWQTDTILPANLYAIMDTHVAQQAQKLGLITNPKESWKAVEELTDSYREWDPSDPLKYDFVLMTENLKP